MTESRRLTGIYGILPADLPLKRLLEKAEAALRGGVLLLQLRDKRQTFENGLQRALVLRRLTADYEARLIVNDSLPIALQSSADGVHLGPTDYPDPGRLRREAGEDLIIGISCKADMTFTGRVLDAGADYVSLGALYPTGSKQGIAVIGIERLKKARELFPDANICAIGGITAERLQEVKAAGADCAAMISALFDTVDVEGQARKLTELWDDAA